MSVHRVSNPFKVEGALADGGYLHPGELELLVLLFKSVSARTVIEFGCNEGRTAAAVLSRIPGIETYVGIDVPEGFQTVLDLQRNEVPKEAGGAVSDSRFSLVLKPGGSRDVTPDDLPVCDAVFIDGDHSGEGVRVDTRLALARIRPGGVLVWHDYRNGELYELAQVLDEFADKNGMTLKHVEGTCMVYWYAPCAGDGFWQSEQI